MRPGRFVLLAGLGLIGALAALAWARARRAPPATPPAVLSPSEPAPPAPPAPAPAAPGPAASSKPAPARVARAVDPDRSRDESAQMAKIRAAVRGNPEQAITLIDAADRDRAGSSFAEERAALRIDALVFAKRIGVARDFAEDFLRRYPLSPYAPHVEALTGVHPRPPEP